ncbi:uncharacterized protein B0T15DRAFT_532890 [Chaetomium strumarium]|uniref:C2H2-type domain-containing protein n=1 Tax=Chaetomium strumarium TaxID=1170767 RepID=A0AAJ0GT16_9PEZI|nr:hypothetical protein B0T15DRAFT_532890 [Chaetomium strumarium]
MFPLDVSLRALVPSNIGEDHGHHASRWDPQHGFYDRDSYLTFQYDDFLQFPDPPFGASDTAESWDQEPLSIIASELCGDPTTYPEPKQEIFFDGGLSDSILVRQDTSSGNAKSVLQPSCWHQCPDCHKQFTAERLRTHRKPRAPGQAPSCKSRYPCPAEQCGKDYADKPGLARHVRQCRHLNADGQNPAGYQCHCGKSFGRWDKFVAHHKRGCWSVEDQQRHAVRYVCQCKESFQSFSSFLEHHRSEYKKVGRPKKTPSM